MPMTWRQRAAEIIRIATRALPEDATLENRVKAVDAYHPGWRESWPSKAWQAARRDYLVRYGYQPKTKKAKASRAAGLPLFKWEND